MSKTIIQRAKQLTSWSLYKLNLLILLLIFKKTCWWLFHFLPGLSNLLSLCCSLLFVFGSLNLKLNDGSALVIYHFSGFIGKMSKHLQD
jgi:hypothetical protein